jgi:hypothetical protein
MIPWRSTAALKKNIGFYLVLGTIIIVFQGSLLVVSSAFLLTGRY